MIRTLATVVRDQSRKVCLNPGLPTIGHEPRKVFCEKSGIRAAYYAQRARKSAKLPIFLLFLTKRLGLLIFQIDYASNQHHHQANKL
jgi:hypothetical protein